MSESQDSQAQAVHDRLVALLSETWNDEQVEDVFGPRCATVSRLSFVRATDSCAYSPASAEDSQPRVDALSLELWRFSTLANLYQPILTRIVDASESSAVVQRTKALRAISLVVAQDPDLFHQDNIRRSIENRMLDSSPQVRDTAIELVGKYVVSRPDLAVQYLPRLSERISDTGLGVRRRVIKLLRVLYHALPDDKYKVDISRKLVYRVFDEDDGIKARLRFCPGLRISRPRLTDCLSRTQELAVETIEEVWFGAPSKSAAQDRPRRSPSSRASSHRRRESSRTGLRPSTRRCGSSWPSTPRRARSPRSSASSSSWRASSTAWSRTSAAWWVLPLLPA